MMLRFGVLLFAFLIWVAPDGGNAQSGIGFDLGSLPDQDQSGILEVLVLDESGLPLEGADVEVRATDDEATSSPFILSTDSNGRVRFEEGRDRGPKILSAWKERFRGMTLLGVSHPRVTFYLKSLPAPQTAKVDVQGRLGGFQSPGSGWDWIRAGLVFKSLSAAHLLSFDLDDFVSPEKDTIDVMGRREIPSNVVLPEQRVYLPIGAIDLNKPEYRLPVRAGDRFRLSAIQAKVRARDVFKSMNGGSVSLDVINRLQFTRVGLTDWLEAGDAGLNHSFDATVDLSPRYQARVQAPPFAADVVVLSVTDYLGDRSLLIPTDVKLAGQKEKPGRMERVELAAPRGGFGVRQDVVAVATADSGKLISGVVASPTEKVIETGAFLAPDPLDDYAELPAQMELRSGSRGITSVIFDSAHNGVSSWQAFLLPGNARMKFPTELVKNRDERPVVRYHYIEMEFATAPTERRELDGGRILSELTRFSRSMARKTQ